MGAYEERDHTSNVHRRVAINGLGSRFNLVGCHQRTGTGFVFFFLKRDFVALLFFPIFPSFLNQHHSLPSPPFFYFCATMSKTFDLDEIKNHKSSECQASPPNTLCIAH